MLRIIGMAPSQVEIGHQAIKALLCAFPLKTLSSARPRAHAPIAFGEFLKVDAFLERNELALSKAAADVFQL